MANIGENLLDRSKQEFNNGEWENFVKGKLIVFMEENGFTEEMIDKLLDALDNAFTAAEKEFNVQG